MKRFFGLLLLVTLPSLACKSSLTRSQVNDSELSVSGKAMSRSVLYPESWKPGYKVKTDSGEWGLADFSYAGYRQGELAIPEGDFAPITTLDLVKDGSKDVSVALQAAIDSVKSSGKPGIIYLPAGKYRLETSLRISGQGIVLRGAGADKTKFFLATPEVSIILGSEKPLVQNNNGWLLAKDAQAGDRFVELTNVTDLKAGQDIVLSWNLTEEFADEHNSKSYWLDSKRINNEVDNFRRIIERVEGQRVYFEVPLFYPVKVRDRAKLRRIMGLTTESGLEDFAVNSALESIEAAWTYFTGGGTKAISVIWSRDVWVRRLKSFARDGKTEHLASHGLGIDRSYRVTVEQVYLQKAQHRGEKGNGYLFILGLVNEVLIKDCRGEDGRHNLTFLGTASASGNVILRFASFRGRICSSLNNQLSGTCGIGPVDTHEPLAISNLFDSLYIEDALQVGNRQSKSNGVGQTGTENVFWATRGPGTAYSFNVKNGYVIGTDPELIVVTKPVLGKKSIEDLALDTEPEDYSELLGKPIQPPSLYEDQLQKRLEQKASSTIE